MKQVLALALSVCLTLSSTPIAFAQAAPAASAPASRVTEPGGDPWPRTADITGAEISIYQPQLNSWNGNQLDAYSAVKIKVKGSDVMNYGVIWFTARTEVDKVNRVVTLDDFALTKRSFPTLANNASEYVAAFKSTMPWTQSMPLDELETALATTSADSEQKRVAVRNDPPRIIFSTTPAVLVSIDGKPVLRPAAEGFVKVLNTRALVVADASTNTYYLALMDGWVEAKSIDGPWSLAENPPAALEKIRTDATANNLNQVLGNDEQSLKQAYDDGEAPRVYVATTQTELLLTRGDPEFASIPGTRLSYVTNSADDIFRDNASPNYYVLIGGRWFMTSSLQTGPWSYEPATNLPADFASIPDYGPKADALVSVPNTPQAKEGIIANQIPQTATISRTAAHATVKYDGAPNFKPIEGTSLTYAVNTMTPVIAEPGGSYYACDTAVWFKSSSPNGPWAVATSIPVDIYAIPPSSPIYYVTYVKIYGYTPTSVYVGYTPGYSGTVLTNDGVVVYGTGYNYPPYIGSTLWVPAPYTYGVGAAFSWSAAAGWALGFGLGLTAGAIGPWWGPVGYWGWGAVAPAWGWDGYGGVASSNFYGHWGNTAFAGTRAAWANPATGNIGAGTRGSFRNPVTGTTGRAARGANFNAYTGRYAAGRAGVGYNPTTGVVKGGAHGVYGNAYTGHAGSVDRGFAYRPSTGNGIAYNGNNVYADHNGNVYRSSLSSGWQQHAAGGWQNLSSSDLRSSLDNHAFSRDLGSQRWGGFRSGGWAGRFGGGGFADRGFGGFGGRFGGGFGGFRGGGFRGGRR
jgi:hypothetical protein